MDLFQNQGAKLSNPGGLFTLPVQVGPRSIAWPSYEVDQLIRAQIAGLSDDKIRDLVTKLMTERRILKLEISSDR
jgi:prophage regulatory protein